MDHLTLIEMYENGIITDMELANSFYRLVTPENVRLLLASTPTTLRQRIIDRAADLEGVTMLRSACISTVVCVGDTNKEIRERRETEENERLLRGAEIVRKYVKL